MSLTAPPPPSAAAIARARWRMFALAVVLSGCGTAVLVVAALSAEGLGDRLDGLGILSVPVFSLVGTLLVAAMVPPALVGGAAGYVFGTAAGTPIALAAAAAGAALCAVLCRAVVPSAARSAFGRRVARTIAWAEARPLRSVALSRLVPGLPFNATSYVLGLTSIRLGVVAGGTALGFAPRCFAYVALGGSLRDLSSREARFAFGASAALAVLVIVLPRLLLRHAVPALDPSEETTHDG